MSPQDTLSHRSETINSSRDQTKALYTEISFWFRSENDAYRKYTGIYISWCLEHFFFRTVCIRAYRWPKWPHHGTTGRTRGLQIERSFSMMQDFWQSSEAVGLSQVSKMLQQLTGQILAHYPSSKIRNTHLRLFRLDQ